MPDHTLDDDALTAIEDAALAYPRATPDDFRASFLYLKNDAGDVFQNIDPARLRLAPGTPVTLPGAERPVPSWMLAVPLAGGGEIVLENRVALAGIGSNAARPVLARKFSGFTASAETGFAVCVVSATIDDHAVVHGAFLGARGPVPATLHADSGSSATVTIGFYDPGAAAHMTGTEPNYDALLMETPARLAGGQTIDAPLAYVAIWGAMQDPERPNRPLALSVVPHGAGDLRALPSLDALARAAQATDGIATAGPDGEKLLRRYLRENITDTEQRMARIAALQQTALPANVRGARVYRAALADYMANMKR